MQLVSLAIALEAICDDQYAESLSNVLLKITTCERGLGEWICARERLVRS